MTHSTSYTTGNSEPVRAAIFGREAGRGRGSEILHERYRDSPHRQQDLYWTELVELKIACEYMRRYRNSLAWWSTGFSAFRAIASSGAIATWAVVQSYPLIWGGIIAATQVADALKDVFPLTARQQAASSLMMSLDALFIEALYEWEGDEN
jgi:hypothetical protein